ncbi:MAG: energy-coupled thiamine transporter ThiT [Firmicutes bacterium]|nr:energy-coupled thiamine transporter ThiT [Bacillota bacterium]
MLFLAQTGGKAEVAAFSAPFALLFTLVFFLALAVYYTVKWRKAQGGAVASAPVCMGLAAGYALGIAALYIYLFAMPYDAEGAFQDVIKGMLSLAGSYILYLSIGVILALCAVLVLVYRLKKDSFAPVARFCGGLAVGYAVAIIAVFTYLNVWRSAIKEELGLNFWLTVGFFAAVVLLGAVGLVIRRYAKKAFRVYLYAAGAAVVLYGILLCCLIPAAEPDYEPLSSAGMYICSLVLVAVIAVLALLFGKDPGTASQTKQIAYAGVCISLSFALSYVKFFSLPQGGSVTFASLLPLMLYAYMFGARKGVFAGVIYGFLQFIQSPQFYQPMQALIDYPIAFGAIGIAGISRRFHIADKKALGRWNVALEFSAGATIAVLLRYAAHFISGYFVFSSWKMEGYTALTWSLVYNLFTIADLAIVLAAGIAFLLPRSISRMVLEVNPLPLAESAATGE